MSTYKLQLFLTKTTIYHIRHKTYTYNKTTTINIFEMPRCTLLIKFSLLEKDFN
jgi:hypothetical protein